VLDEAVVEVLARQGAADFVFLVVVLKLGEVNHLVPALIGGLLVNLEHDFVGLKGHSTSLSATKTRHLYITNIHNKQQLRRQSTGRRRAIRPEGRPPGENKHTSHL